MVLSTNAPTERGSASERVYRVLKEQILTCDLPPGATLNEGRLAEQLAISKTPIREALSLLVHEGFVDVLPRQGYRVRELALADVQEIFQMLQLLEPAAASLAAEHATPEQLRELRELAEEPVITEPEELTAFVTRNREFHVRLAEASGNARLAATLQHTLEELQRLYLAGLDLRAARADHHGEHRELVAALLKGNHHQAQSIAIRQIEATRVRVMEALFAAMSSRSPVSITLNIESRARQRR
jgi:GntR family transcriptional regulator, rspAB operon transcriptional repressor